MVTGKDTEENLRQFFGPVYPADITDGCREMRISVLVNAPPGSPAYKHYAKYDAEAPGWAPRPAALEEQTCVDQVRELQAKIRERVENGRLLKNDDMAAILSEYTANWEKMLPAFDLAINHMDLEQS